jgi:hypothetical protein
MADWPKPIGVISNPRPRDIVVEHAWGDDVPESGKIASRIDSGRGRLHCARACSLPWRGIGPGDAALII